MKVVDRFVVKWKQYFRWQLKPTPLGDSRDPYRIYLLCLAFVSGALLLLGAPANPSVRQELPRWAEVGWALMLTTGSGMALVGMYWQGSMNTALLIKRFGYKGLMWSAYIYSAVLLASAGPGAMLVIGTTALFGFASQMMVRKVNKVVQVHIEHVDEVPTDDGEAS